eukprot:874971_1
MMVTEWHHQFAATTMATAKKMAAATMVTAKKDGSSNEIENDEFEEETMSYQESISTAGPGAGALGALCRMGFQPSANVHDKESASLNRSANVKNRGEESSSDEIEMQDEEDCLSLQESISTAGPGAKALDALCQMAFYQKKADL